MALVKHIPQSVPVSVYRASDAGAPKLTDSAGSLKTLLKTCLITGYGDKAGLGWQMADENSARACFYSADPNANGHGLMVDNANANYVQTYMMGGEGFATYLGYRDKNYTNFGYNNSYAQQNWLLLATPRAFCLVLPDGFNQKSQLLFFGDIAGVYQDSGNTVWFSTSYMNVNYFYPSYFAPNGKPPVIIRSQWRNGGNQSLYARDCSVRSLFFNDGLAYPDPIGADTMASAIICMENDTIRGVLPGLFSCAHDIRAVPELGELVLDGKRFIKVNMSVSDAAALHCYLLALDEWEL